MNLADLEKMCTDLEGISTQIYQKKEQLNDLEQKAEQMKEKVEAQKLLAEIRGEKPSVEYGLEELDQAKKELDILKNQLEELKKQALKGMAEIDLPVSREPEMDSEGSMVTTLEGGPYEKSAKFVADKFDSSVPLDVDGVILYPDRIVVTKIGDPKKGLQKLLVFKQNIRRVAKVVMGEEDPEIKKVVDFMRKSAYRDIWETVGTKQEVVFENLYGELGITDSSGKTRVRNFFINCRTVLGEAFPFINIRTGVWKRTFFGLLVWRRYYTLYMSKKEPEDISKEAEKMVKGEAEIAQKKTEPKIQTLNEYVKTKELDKILYGNI